MSRAIIRHHKRPARIVVLCPIGHLLDVYYLDRTFAGSAFEAELGAHAAGNPNRFDRAAAQCDGAGHEAKERAK